MLRPVDNEAATGGAPIVDRQRWMSVLAKADPESLERGMAAYLDTPYTWLRKPETGLAMVRGRIGGTGDRFNLGEVTVTRCVLRLPGGSTGVAYVQGRSHRKCELAALADALLQDAGAHAGVFRSVVEPAMRAQAADDHSRRQRAQATRVEFFTIAREAGP